MKLKLSWIKQTPGSDDCLRYCLLMVFKYLGVKVAKEEVWELLPVYKKGSGLWGSYYTDAGKAAIAQGLKVTIIHGNWTWWDKYCAQAKGKKELKEAIEQLKKIVSIKAQEKLDKKK